MKRGAFNREIKGNDCEFLTKKPTESEKESSTICNYYISIDDYLKHETKTMRGRKDKSGKTSIMKRHYDNFKGDIFWNYLYDDEYWSEIMKEIKENYVWNQKYWEHHQLFDATMRDLTGKRYNNYRRLWRAKVTKSSLSEGLLPEIMHIIDWYWHKVIFRDPFNGIKGANVSLEKKELVKELLYTKGAEHTKVPVTW